MRLLQDLFDKELKRAISFPNFASRVISKKLMEQGVELTEGQAERISAFLQEKIDQRTLEDNLHITISDSGDIGISPSSSVEQLKVDISDLVDEELGHLFDQLPEAITLLAEETSRILLEELKSLSDEIINSNEKDRRKFNKSLLRIWEEPLRLLEIFILISEEFGNEYNDRIRSSIKENPSLKFEVLVRLHARACQVAKEILILLNHGFADGAHARWRTLHELSVDANLISRYDDDLAQRYLDHDIVQRYKSAKIYQKYCRQIGFEPLTEDELNHLRTTCDQVVLVYGKDFYNDNGWAIEITGKGKNRFYDLESFVDLAQIHPFYTLANLNVHAGPRGLLFRLGLTSEQHKRVMLSGSSVIGLGDPIQNAAYSLMLLTTYLLTFDTNLDCLVILNLLMKLEGEIFDAVEKAIR